MDQFGRVLKRPLLQPKMAICYQSMKRLLGLLLQVLWSQQVNHFDFQFKNFIVWFIRLGFPVAFQKNFKC